MSDTAILCFIKEEGSNKMMYSKFIRKVPRIGEQIFIGDTWSGEVLRIEHILYENDVSHIIYIYLKT